MMLLEGQSVFGGGEERGEKREGGESRERERKEREGGREKVGRKGERESTYVTVCISAKLPCAGTHTFSDM